MNRTAISWTDVTWNPIRGCTRVSEGCRNCYAEAQAARIVRMGKGKPTPYDGLVKLVNGEPRWTGKVVLDPSRLSEPLTWRRPRVVFVDSMSDLFYGKRPDEHIAAVFGVMAATRHITYQILTKYAKRMREWFEWAAQHGDGYDKLRFGPSALLTCAWEACSGDAWADVEPPGVLESLPSAGVFGAEWPLPNVWLGVSVENQDAADERIPELLRTPAAARFLSCEPLLGPVDLTSVAPNSVHHCDSLAGETRYPIVTRWKRVDWVIAGCESGPGARPCDVAWLRSLRDQCQAAGIPFFLKQAVEGPGITFGEGSRRKPGGVIELPYLDGVQHSARPEVRR